MFTANSFNTDYNFHFEQNMTLYSPQIVKTLAEQVQNLAPIRDSFRRLEQYYMQLTGDLDQLLSESEVSENELMANLRYLQEINRSLERQFGGCADDLRQLDCEYARMQMESKQLLAQGQALKGRQLLQAEQKASYEDKREDLLDLNNKLTFAIGKFKEMVHNIELAIKSKEYENLDIEKEIKKMELVNQKIRKLNKESEESIDSVHLQNQEAVQQIYELEDRLGTYNKLIDVKEKQNKESLEVLISKTEELEQLKHRKDYIDKLIEGETAQQRELTKNQGELESILSAKQEKLMFVEQDNNQFSKMIQNQRETQITNNEELRKLKLYLQTLVSTNEELFRELEKSCAQDREVQVMLSDKLERLLIINDEVVQNDLQNRPETVNPRLFRERNEPSHPKVFFETRSKKVNQSISPNASLIDKLNFTRTQQFSSTWGSKSKENLIVQ